jgi:hypothetical protein
LDVLLTECDMYLRISLKKGSGGRDRLRTVCSKELFTRHLLVNGGRVS